MLSLRDPMPIYGQEKMLPTPHELRRIYEGAQAAKPMFDALISRGRIERLPFNDEIDNQRIEEVNRVSMQWLITSTQVGAAWLGSHWEPQARAMLDALPSFDDVGRLWLGRTLYGVHNGEDGEPVVVVVTFDYVGVPQDIRLCRPRPQEPPHLAANRATYNHKAALWIMRDTYAMDSGPRRPWIMEPSDTTDALAARLWAVVCANPTPSHISLLRAQHELACVAVGHTPPDQTPTFDALACAFPQILGAKAKAQAYAMALQQEPAP